MREELSNEIFRPHYTPNTVIARTKVMEQMKSMAAHGAYGSPPLIWVLCRKCDSLFSARPSGSGR